MNQRYCRKCLLDKVFEEDEYKNLQDYLSSIDEEIKTDESEYKKRLDICTNCDNLFNGMCRICGCFVEMRAAVKKNYCPDIKKLW
ncbi:DUF6171 family protein [Clostridium sp. SM-530-WT-3G]|uniref:DUF6171 family protein n=1 Tax=Clostridium sp. SM-530-WT-3G TaxID=2725303 RepID=UPI000EBD6192|nr:DUF6171 family protein [Clostridium sp. SM-530-WT-3G]NME83721.1 hypothetical protein [Clostridium sp. SM-530-WT-3G]HCW54070.1 hypothetical protein [Clostridium sp.]